ncbi:MAG: amidohydrolase [Chloroflexi bacterium]|nr:amidohydrolase [Chloroflexota bacterium]MCH8283473.1 amidohydrolase [Chloroflexota bacterium]
MKPTGREYNVISGDSHIIEPPDLWTKWLDEKYQDKAPKLVSDGDGGDAWLYQEGFNPEPLGLVTCVGTRPEDLKWTGVRYGKEILPACYDGKARLEALDVDGVDAEILYPPVRASLTFTRQSDPEVQLAGLHAYNDWLMNDFCAADPDRLFGIAQMPNLDIEASIADIKRAKEMGFRGVLIYNWPSGAEAISRADDPFWAAAEEMEMPVSIHLMLASQIQGQRRAPVQEAGAAIGASAFATIMPLMVELIFTGVFDRFPKLKMVAVETGAGWIPHFLEMVDDRYWRNRIWAKVDLKKVPSRYFHDNWLATFIVDRIGVEIRHAIGVENMSWSTDFPHHGNDWPYSRRTIDEHFVNVPDDDRKKIVCDNIAKLYGLVD